MRRPPAGVLILASGLLVFGVVFSLLQFSPSRAEPPGQSGPTAPSYVVGADSLAPSIADGDEAIGVPTSGAEALLRSVQRGDRLDIVASLVSPNDGQPLTAVVARGVTVLRPYTGGDPLLIEVPASDAVMLAHLVMNGTHLGYILWPASGVSADVAAPSLDDQTVRDALGLSQATPRPTAAATLVPTAVPTMPPHTQSGFLYQVQPNDTWDSIAGTFGIAAAELRQWNEASNAGDPAPGSLVFIPRAL